MEAHNHKTQFLLFLVWWRKMTAQAIIQLRKKLKLTQGELADLLLVDRATVNRWEKNHKKPSRIHVMQLERLATGGRDVYSTK